MATPTYDLLESVTLATSATSVTFSSIDQSYGDLVLVCNLGANNANGLSAGVRVNDSTTDYSFVLMRNSGSSTQGIGGTAGYFKFFNSAGNTSSKALHNMNFFDYSSTDKHKSVLARHNVDGTAVSAVAYRWANTNAITKLDVMTNSSSYEFAAGSTINLYGVAK